MKSEKEIKDRLKQERRKQKERWRGLTGDRNYKDGHNIKVLKWVLED